MATPKDTSNRVNRLVDWNVDTVAKLRELHARGLKPTAIAREIPFATRNAVVGKLDRLGLLVPMARREVVIKPIPARIRPERSSFNPGKPELYQEPVMPVLPEGAPLHSRPYKDLDAGMCYYPLYFEQGVQMYCAAHTERLPGRFATYCNCHKVMTEDRTRRRKYRGIWRGPDT